MSSNTEIIISHVSELEKAGKYIEALGCLDDAIHYSSHDSQNDISFAIYLEKSKILERTGRYHEALDNAKLALKKAKDENQKITALLMLSACENETNDLTSAQHDLHNAIDLARQIQDIPLLCQALQALASFVYIIQGKFDLALSVIDEVQQLYSQIGKPNWNIPFTRAFIWITIGERRKARITLDELLPHVQPGTRIAGAYYYLWAVLALDEGELSKADEYLHLALRIANMLTAPDLAIWVRIEKSRLFRLREEFASAHVWADDAVRYAERIGIKYFKGLAYTELALVLWALSENISLEDIFANALRNFQEIDAQYENSRVLFFLSAWQRHINHLNADETWVRAIELISNHGYAFLLQREHDLAFPLIASHLRIRSPSERKNRTLLIANLKKVSPPPLKIYGLGQFRVWQGFRLIPDEIWQKRKAGELLRFLLIKPNLTASRETILDSLWPDKPLDKAQFNYHQATSTLRRILEPDLPDKFISRYLETDGDRACLILPSGSSFDVSLFENRIIEAIRNRRLDLLRSAISLYTGDLFPMDRFLDWSSILRTQLDERHTQGLLLIAELFYAQKDFAQAITNASLVLQKDQWNEDAVLILMQSYIALGNNTRAMLVFQTLEKNLRNDFEIAPRKDLILLRQTLIQS